MYRMLSFVLYYAIEDYVCIDYIFFQSKTLSSIPSDKIFELANYNILLDIGIPEVLMNLVSCHGLMKKPNSTVILNCQYRLVNYYLSEGFIIIRHSSKQLGSVLNDVKLIIHAVNKQRNKFCYGVHHSNLLSSKHHK